MKIEVKVTGPKWRLTRWFVAWRAKRIARRLESAVNSGVITEQEMMALLFLAGFRDALGRPVTSEEA